jgi:hypothetical protein
MGYPGGRLDIKKEPALLHHTTIRLVSILIVASLAGLLSDYHIWNNFVFSFGFCHYAMALYYSKNKATQMLSQPSSYMPLVIVLMFGGLLYWRDFSLVIYFAAHHMFNEVYLMKFSNRVEDHPSMSRLRTSSLFLNLFVYLVLLQDHRDLRLLDPRLFYSGLALSIASYVFYLTAVRSSMTRLELIDASAFELIGLLLVGLSFFVKITFLQIVCYHFVFWVLYPMGKIRAQGSGELTRYLGWTAGLTAFFFLLSPVGLLRHSPIAALFYPQFILWSYIHITISYALSSSHPEWITRWFKPQPVIQSSVPS